MGLKRVGMSLFGFGLLFGSVVAVVFGLFEGSTDVGCPPGVEPLYSLERVALVPVQTLGGTPLSDLVRPRIVVNDGCNALEVSVLAQWAALFVLLGVVVGAIGLLRSRS
ncbi:hypothetical protein ACFQPA_03330 [Halomarina halobia]|uniref:Uncharacterized protein n=1 Tax=Halomarina halobia TaxID=3033386 RepID=A0ABD6A4B8_9EURY|nr:hypothetical protein [Halomarina sp. PSR21]